MIAEFSPRMQQILKILLRDDRVWPVQHLADHLNVSRRTVQRELEYVEKPLKKHGLLFRSKAGAGVWLEGTAEDKAEFLKRLEEEESLDISDKTERRKRLLLEILKDKALKKLFYYSDLFGVSEATISSDLENVEGWLLNFQLKIVRKQGLGISIEGSEESFRRALRAFIDENIDTRMVRELYEGRNESLYQLLSDKAEKNIYRILDEDIMKRVIRCIMRLNDKRIKNLTENSYVGLVIHVTIAVNRILKMEMMEENQTLVESLRQEEEFQLASDIAENLGKEFGVAIPEVETAYICLHIKGAKVQQAEIPEESREQIEASRELLDTVNEMIDCYDKDIAYALKQDEEFVVQGLLAHLQPTLVRLANHMKIQNPLLEHIKKEYADIYKRCEGVAQVLTRRYGYQVPDTEIGFLAIHFGAAVVRMENRKEIKRKVKIGVVCASGIGISRLMISKLNRQFMDRTEICAYGTYDITPFVTEHLDFLISTMPVKAEIETLFVSPLLTSEEMEEIEKRIRCYERLPAKKVEENTFTRQLEQVNFMAAQIKSIINEMGYLLVNPYITFDELLVAVSEMASPYNDRRTMIQEDLKRREKISSQIFPEFGFALLHTRTKGVVRPGFSVCQTKDFDTFKDPYFHEIGVVIIMLLPIDEHVGENSQILGFLSEMLVEEFDFLAAIAGGTKEEIRQALSDYLKKFFNQYLDKV